MTTDPSDHYAFVGTYTDRMYTCSLTAATGTLERLTATDAGQNPSFLAVHPDKEHLYAVNSVDEGRVTALSLDRDSGALTVLNRVATGGRENPCYCSVDQSGQYLLVALYTGGVVVVVPIEDDGRLGQPSQIVEHEGSGPNEDRQARPHPHSIRPGPQNRFVYVPDLGADRVFVYELDTDAGRLEPAPIPSTELPPGSGPRHLDFHPTSNVVYLVNELNSTLTALERDSDTGALTVVETVPTLPEDFDGENTAADVHVHDSGQWVYASNRGHDSIAVFEVGDDETSLTPVQHVSTGGSRPRNFALTPSGTHLLAANAGTDDIVTFALDDADGTLTPTGSRLNVPTPTCLQFVPRP
jgi:6-phosphogluconolactonase